MSKQTHFDILKVLAMFLVVFAHVTRNMVVATPPSLGIDNWLLRGITDFIYAFHMPAFIFVSGAVFQYGVDKGKYQQMFPFIINKAKRLLLPYLFFVALLFLTLWQIGSVQASGMSVPKYIIANYLLCLNPAHLWFLVALFWISIIGLCVKCLNFCIVVWGGVILYVASGWMPSYFQLASVAHYAVFYVAGMLYQRYCAKMRVKHPVMAITVSFAILTVLYFAQESVPALGMFTAFAGIAFLLLLSMSLSQTELTDKVVYKLLSRNNFGVYLFHPILIYLAITYIAPISVSTVKLMLYAIALTIIVYTLSWMLTAMMRKTRLKLFIGE